MRIVSLLPSATEIICGLGLRDQLVGVMHECDYPADVSDLPKVTQTTCLADVFECIRQVGIAAGIGGYRVRSQLCEAPEGLPAATRLT